MSSRTLDRKQFISLIAASATLGTLLQACGDDATPTPSGSAGTGNTGTGGTSSGGTGSGGTGSTASGGTGSTASGGTGSTASGGTGSTASGGTGSTGSGGTGSGGTGSTGSGGTGHGGTGAGGTGAGGTGAGGTGSSGGMCGTAMITQPDNPMMRHTHVSVVSGATLDAAGVTKLMMDLKTLINGSMATMAFTLPADGPSGMATHTHTITLTAAQVTTLKGGGMVMGVMSSTDSTHSHTYTISCS